jgi:hypothetical protein
MTANQCRLFCRPPCVAYFHSQRVPDGRPEVRWLHSLYQAELQLLSARSMIGLRRGEIEPLQLPPLRAHHMNNDLDLAWYFFERGMKDAQSLWPPSACVQHGTCLAWPLEPSAGPLGATPCPADSTQFCRDTAGSESLTHSRQTRLLPSRAYRHY